MVLNSTRSWASEYGPNLVGTSTASISIQVTLRIGQIIPVLALDRPETQRSS